MTGFNEFRQAAGRRITQPLTPLLSQSRISPNTLTIIGLIINLVAAVVIALGYFIAGGLLVLFSGVFDLLDGALARHRKQTTLFGALLDSTVDRVTESAIFFGIAFYYLALGSNLEVLLAFLALTGSFLISYVRARAEGLNIECKVGFFTRAERVVLLVLGLLVNQILIMLAVMAIFTFATAIQRIVHVWRQARKPLKDTK